MKIKKGLIVAVLATLCLAVTLFATVPTKSQSGGYDPWVDVNNDGSIDMLDISIAIDDFMTYGTPLTKAGIMYDSGWVNISDKAGEFFDVTHNLGIYDWGDPDIMIEFIGKTTVDGPILRSGTVAGFNETYVTSLLGALYVPLSAIQKSDGGYAFAGYCDVPYEGRRGILVFTDSSARWTEDWGFGAAGLNYAGTSVLQLSDGNFMMAGYTNASGAGGYDAWLVEVRYPPPPVSHTYGGAGNDYFYAMVQTSDGFALAGSTDSFGNWTDVYLVKTDFLGNMQWSKHYGGTSWDEANAVIQTSDGGYALAGQTFSYGAGENDFYLVKTDAAGNMQWNKTYGGPSFDRAYSLVQTSDNGYALAGYTRSFSNDPSDFWLVKTDSNGEFQWARSYGGAGIEGANSLIKTSDGGFAMAGYTTSFGARLFDFYLVKTDGSGISQWSKTIGGSGDDEAYSVIQTDDGGYVMVGNADCGASLGTFPYLVKLSGMPRLCVSCVICADSALTFYRESGDTEWNYLRVRIIKRK